MYFQRGRWLIAIMVLLISGWSLNRPAYAQTEAVTASVIGVTDMDGVPDGMEQSWYAAHGYATMIMGGGGTDAVTVNLQGLIPDGLYTLWWVNTDPSMSMGAAGGLPNNEFSADENGAAFVTITVPSDNNYQTLVVAYHADGQTHGDNPGRAGSETFSHLVGAFPGPSGIVRNGTLALGAVDMDGVPEGLNTEAWLAASAYVSMTRGLNGDDTVVVHARNLVPGGLYTLWRVNNMGNVLTMSMGPAGGLPANEFVAAEDGSATLAIKVPSDNDYQTLVVAFHADGVTHGDNPGQMGSETFSHLMGGFPGAGGMSMSRAVQLTPTDMDGAPAEGWLNASAIAGVSMGTDGNDTVVIYASDLVPNGLYTLWWVNNMGNMLTMSMGPAGGLPANEFSADANGNAVIAITVPSTNDYQTLAIAYHADGQTHGDNPGRAGSETFTHLMGAFPGPAGAAMGGM